MPNAVLVNFASGETSPRSRGRFDLDWFRSSVEKLVNFVCEVPGPARFRTGFKHVAITRRGQRARMFQFRPSRDFGYMLEFTNLKMRAYRDGALLKTSRTTITAATRANPCVITVASTTDLADEDEIICTDVQGMFELNGRQVVLANQSGNTFELRDPVTGLGVDSTNWGAWTSGGTVYEVYEITTPYPEADLDDLQVAQSSDTMYIVCPSYDVRKLTLTASDTFAIAVQSRTADPFATAYATRNLASATPGTAGPYPPGVETWVSFTSGFVFNTTVSYTITGVVGMTELNGLVVRMAQQAGPYFRLVYASTGLNIDSSAFGAYVSGGTMTPVAEVPLTVGFYEGRLVFFGTNQRPNTLFMSRAPNDDDPRYDDFTGGTAADHACFFAFAPASGQVDHAAWLAGMADYLFAGTFGGPFRVSGSGLDEAITPSNILVRQIDLVGCEAALPVGGARVFFIQRGGRSLRTLRYDGDGKLETYDMLLNAEHIGYSRLQRVILQTGRPDVLWVVREDGTLAGMTVQGSENVAGWHRHFLGGVDASVLDAQALPRTDKDDQLWVVVQRTVQGVARCSVEVQADLVDFPAPEDFYNGGHRVFLGADEAEPRGLRPLGKEEDLKAHKNAVYRRQEEYVHLDAAGTYNGSDRGVAAGASLTLSALTGNGITATASAAVFKSTDVGLEIWKKPDRVTGVGAGRATITAYVSATEVTVNVIVDFDTLEVIGAGAWHFAATNIYVPHLEGCDVSVVTDGAVYAAGEDVDADYPLVTVTDGKITLARPAAVVHVGFSYEGFVKTHNLELGALAQAKPRLLSALFIRFLSTLGVDYGTDLYDLERIEHRNAEDRMDRPAPVFSGIRRVKVEDSWTEEAGKHVYLSQKLPLPCVIQFVDARFDATEEV